MPGTLFVVATPIGNLEDITVRALRVLREAAVIAAEDTRRTSRLLSRHAIRTPTTSLHAHNEAQKSAALIARLVRGESVALVSDAGTPTISDPGRRLIQLSIEAGIPVEPIPGPSAILAALSVSGFPTDTFTFLGFPPPRAHARVEWFNKLKSLAGTVVFFEAPHRIHATLRQVQQTVGDCQAVICRELTKLHQELVRGPISRAPQALTSGRGEFTVVLSIGHITDITTTEAPGDAWLADEFGDITENRRLSSREAVKELARRHAMKPNDVYEAVLRGRKLVEQQK
jgi:16S rRNA (cytidine1402-2'-O)-methyltransferase